MLDLLDILELNCDEICVISVGDEINNLKSSIRNPDLKIQKNKYQKDKIQKL